MICRYHPSQDLRLYKGNVSPKACLYLCVPAWHASFVINDVTECAV